MKTTVVRQRTGQRGQPVVIEQAAVVNAACASYAAVPGRTVRQKCVHRTGGGSALSSSPTSLAFGLSRTSINPFFLYSFTFSSTDDWASRKFFDDHFLI